MPGEGCLIIIILLLSFVFAYTFRVTWFTWPQMVGPVTVVVVAATFVFGALYVSNLFPQYIFVKLSITSVVEKRSVPLVRIVSLFTFNRL